jgi:hypothetical protein
VHVHEDRLEFGINPILYKHFSEQLFYVESCSFDVERGRLMVEVLSVERLSPSLMAKQRYLATICAVLTFLDHQRNIVFQEGTILFKKHEHNSRVMVRSRRSFTFRSIRRLQETWSLFYLHLQSMAWAALPCSLSLTRRAHPWGHVCYE